MRRSSAKNVTPGQSVRGYNFAGTMDGRIAYGYRGAVNWVGN
jgi:hypothetical protein